MLSLQKKKAIMPVSILKKREKKLFLILEIFTLVTATKKKTGRNDENSKNSKYPKTKLI